MANGQESDLVKRMGGIETRVDRVAERVERLGEGMAQLRSETSQNIQQLRSEMNHIHHDLVERIERSETNLLKAFYATRNRPISGSAASTRTSHYF
jgi:hypothetical protein